MFFLVTFGFVFTIVYLSLTLHGFLQLVEKFSSTEVELQSDQNSLEEFKQDPTNEENVNKITLHLLKEIFTKKGKESGQTLKDFFILIASLKQDCGVQTYVYLRNYISPYLVGQIFEAVNKGIIAKTVDYIEEKTGSQFITKLGDALRGNDRLRVVAATFLALSGILLVYSDLFKDVALFSNILQAVGGFDALMNYGTQFGCVLFFVFFGGTIIPWLITNVELVINFGDELFFKLNSESVMKNMMNSTLNMGIFLFSPLILIHLQQTIQEKLRVAVKEGRMEEAMKYLRKLNRVSLQKSKCHRIELSLENYCQVPALIIVLLLARTSTPLTGGLTSMFTKTSSLFGMTITAEQMLIISTIWSLKSCFILQLKSMVVEKCYFSTTSKLIAVMWALFATCRRVLTIITFFTPCMGLFSASYHYHFEQIPYSARIQYAKVQNITTEDRIYLHGLEKDVKWTEIDRWTYKGSTPTPPGISVLLC